MQMQMHVYLPIILHVRKEIIPNHYDWVGLEMDNNAISQLIIHDKFFYILCPCWFSETNKTITPFAFNKLSNRNRYRELYSSCH